MTESELPAEAAEEDALEQQTDVVAGSGEGPGTAPSGDLPTEADPADVAEQAQEISQDPEEYAPY